MPFKSEAQRRWMYSQRPEMAERWERHTPKGKKLPRKVRRRVANTARRVNTRRLDPTQSITARRQMIAALRKQFALLKGRIIQFVGVGDAFGVGDAARISVVNCGPGQLRDERGRCGPGIGIEIPREQMPQIPANKLDELIEFARNRGVAISHATAKADDLSPTQARFRQEKVDALHDEAAAQPILVSSDDYILDGTHRWVRQWQADKESPVHVLRVDLPLREALRLLHSFPGSKYAANSLEPDPEMAQDQALQRIAREASRRKESPDYGRLFWKSETNEVWYVTADSDSEEFAKWVKDELEAASIVHGVWVEAEAFPPTDGSWQEIYPHRKVWNGFYQPFLTVNECGCRQGYFSASHILDVPHASQKDKYSCGAACALAVGLFHGVGPETQDAWKEALGTNPKNGTESAAIAAAFQLLGCAVEVIGRVVVNTEHDPNTGRFIGGGSKDRSSSEYNPVSQVELDKSNGRLFIHLIRTYRPGDFDKEIDRLKGVAKENELSFIEGHVTGRARLRLFKQKGFVDLGADPQQVGDTHIHHVRLVVNANPMAQLAAYTARGWPVICCIQDYGPSPNSGHWVTVTGVGDGYIFLQDPAADAGIAEGRVMVSEEKWLENWHDEDADGRELVRYGIAVGPPITDNEQLRDALGRFAGTVGGAIGAIKQWKAAVGGKLAEYIDKVPGGKKVRLAVAGLKAGMERRYGKATAGRIIMAANIISWGAFTAGPVIGYPNYIPATGLMLGGAVIAEASLQIRHGYHKLTGNVAPLGELRDIDAATQEFYDDVLDAVREHCPMYSSARPTANEQSRDEHGRWTRGEYRSRLFGEGGKWREGEPARLRGGPPVHIELADHENDQYLVRVMGEDESRIVSGHEMEAPSLAGVPYHIWEGAKQTPSPRRYDKAEGQLRRVENFSPSEARDAFGRWTAGAASAVGAMAKKLVSAKGIKAVATAEGWTHKPGRELAKLAGGRIEQAYMMLHPTEGLKQAIKKQTFSFVAKIADERGFTGEEKQKLINVLATTDKVLGKAGRYVALATGNVGVYAASKVPAATVAYVAYSTAKNPLATFRAARGLVKGWLGKKPAENATYSPDAERSKPRLTPDIARRIADDMKDWTDWQLAVYFAALHETGDLEQALKAAEEIKEPKVTPAQDDADAVFNTQERDSHGRFTTYTVGVAKDYFPKEHRIALWGGEEMPVGENAYVEVHKVEAKNREEAAHAVWAAHGERLLPLMHSHIKKVSLFVNEPKLGAGGKAGRLSPIRVHDATKPVANYEGQPRDDRGRFGSGGALGKVVGAQPGLRVGSYHEEGKTKVSVLGEGVDCEYTIAGDNLNIDHMYFMQTGTGLGSKMIVDMVHGAREAGLKTLSLYAARKDSDDAATAMNGYYTWPKLGFDMKLDDSAFDDKVAAAKLAVPGVETVMDVVNAPKLSLSANDEAKLRDELLEIDRRVAGWRGKNVADVKPREHLTGSDYWLSRGFETESEFDLDPQSRSSKVLDAYAKAKQAREASQTARNERASGGDRLERGGGNGAGGGLAEDTGGVANYEGQPRDVAGRFGVGVVPQQGRKGGAVAWMKSKTKELFHKLEARYGRKNAVAILIAGHAIGLATPLVVIPGSTFLGTAAMAGLAEIIHQSVRGVKALTGNEDDLAPLADDEIHKEALTLLRELKALVERAPATNAFCPTGEGGGVDPSCSSGSAKDLDAELTIIVRKLNTERLTAEERTALGKRRAEVYGKWQKASTREAKAGGAKEIGATGLKVGQRVSPTGHYEDVEVPVKEVEGRTADTGSWDSDSQKALAHYRKEYRENGGKFYTDARTGVKVGPPNADVQTVKGVVVKPKLLLGDGSHRFAAAVLEGAKKVLVRVPTYVVRNSGLVWGEASAFALPATNAFCPTGEGGGVDPSCSPHVRFSSLGFNSTVSNLISSNVKRIVIANPAKMAKAWRDITNEHGVTKDASPLGFYVPSDKTVYVRSGEGTERTLRYEKIGSVEVTGTLQHELGHALDDCLPIVMKEHRNTVFAATSDAEFSRKNDAYARMFALPTGVSGTPSRFSDLGSWHEAWAEDVVKKGQIGDYAAVNPSEGFAEFSRLASQYHDKLSVINRKFPKCYAFWRSFDLIGKGKARHQTSNKNSSNDPVRIIELFQLSRAIGDVRGDFTRVPAVNVREWDAHSDPDKVKAFAGWLEQQMAQTLTSSSQEELWRRYVQWGFEKGVGRSFDDMRKRHPEYARQSQDFYKGTREEFLRSSFARPVAVEKVQLLAGRAFEDLKGVTADMAHRIRRALTDGLVQGSGPMEIAKAMASAADIPRQRAELIARTEMTRAHAGGQLDALRRMGVQRVGVEVEFSTADDFAVCPLCEALEGTEYALDGAEGVIPVHPNCRCAFLPSGEVVVGNRVYSFNSRVYRKHAAAFNKFNPLLEERDEHGRFAGGSLAAEVPEEEKGTKAEQASSRKLAFAKIAAAPVPTKEQVAKALAELERSRRGEGRVGGDSRGGSAKDRRKQRINLFNEWGGAKKGYVVCPWSGQKMHHTDDPEQNPHGYPLFERGKVFTKCQGGSYRLPNLIPESFSANRARNDERLRDENASDC